MRIMRFLHVILDESEPQTIFTNFLHLQRRTIVHEIKCIGTVIKLPKKACQMEAILEIRQQLDKQHTFADVAIFINGKYRYFLTNDFCIWLRDVFRQEAIVHLVIHLRHDFTNLLSDNLSFSVV